MAGASSAEAAETHAATHRERAVFRRPPSREARRGKPLVPFPIQRELSITVTLTDGPAPNIVVRDNCGIEIPPRLLCRRPPGPRSTPGAGAASCVDQEIF